MDLKTKHLEIVNQAKVDWQIRRTEYQQDCRIAAIQAAEKLHDLVGQAKQQNSHPWPTRYLEAIKELYYSGDGFYSPILPSDTMLSNMGKVLAVLEEFHCEWIGIDDETEEGPAEFSLELVGEGGIDLDTSSWCLSCGLGIYENHFTFEVFDDFSSVEIHNSTPFNIRRFTGVENTLKYIRSLLVDSAPRSLGYQP